MGEIQLKPEYVLQVGNILISYAFFTSVITTAILILVAALLGKSLKGVFGTSTGQLVAEFIFQPLWNLCYQVLGDATLARRAFPFIATFFVFIITANWIEVLPGFLGALYVHAENGANLSLFRSPSTDLNTTLALGLVSVGFTQVIAMQVLGPKAFFLRIVNIRKPIQTLAGILEFMSEFSKIFSFAFRLFGNMFAGGVLLLVTGFLVPYIIPLPFMVLEIFVGFIQALVFALLSLMFIKAASSHG